MGLEALDLPRVARAISTIIFALTTLRSLIASTTWHNLEMVLVLKLITECSLDCIAKEIRLDNLRHDVDYDDSTMKRFLATVLNLILGLVDAFALMSLTVSLDLT